MATIVITYTDGEIQREVVNSQRIAKSYALGYRRDKKRLNIKSVRIIK